jgi:DNA-binding transcriptional LysR family regulator
VVYRSDHNATVQGLVAAGLGVAIVPSLTVDPSSSDVCMIEITPEIPPKSIGIAWHRDRYRSTASERFVDVAAIVCAGASRTA